MSIREFNDLAFQNAGSDKVYHAAIFEVAGGFNVIFAYGRRGAALTHGTKTPAPVDLKKAESIYSKLLNEKISKGYVQKLGVSGNVFGVSASPSVSSPALSSAPVATVISISSKVQSGILPQLLNTITEEQAMRLIDDDAFGAQEKKNGKRLICDKASSNIRGVNKKGIEIVPAYEIATAISTHEDGTYDGEAIGQTLHTFDLLSYSGACLRHLSYEDRYVLLERILKPSANIKLVPLARTREEKLALYNRVMAENGEGLVFKRLDSVFAEGRPNSGGDQLKMKFWRQATVCVASINPSKRSVTMSMLENGMMVGVGSCTVPPNYPMPAPGALFEVRYLYAYRNGGSLFQPQYEGERDDADVDTTDSLTYYTGEELDEAA